MGRSECLDLGASLAGELQPHDALVGGIGDTPHEPSCLGPTDQLDRAVVPQHQVIGDLADRWRLAVTADREEELVLRPGEAHRCRLLFAPPQKTAQPVAEGEQTGEVGIGELSTGFHRVTILSGHDDVEVVVVDSGPGGDAVSHRHPWQELYFLLDGLVDVQIGARQHRLEAGGMVTIPPRALHAFNVISERARFLHVSAGHGATAMFHEFAERVPHTPTLDDLPVVLEVGARHGIELALPPELAGVG